MYRNIPVLYRVMESFFRYRNLFLVASVIVTVIPAAVLLTRKPSYTSTANVQVIADSVGDALGQNTRVSWVPVSQQNVNKFNELLTDDAEGGFVDQALHRANLSRPINVDPRAKDPRLAQLRKGLNCTSISDSVFIINLVWENPTECEQIVKAMQDQYIEQVGLDKQATSREVSKFLDSELKKYSKRLRDAEDIVNRFKSQNHGASVEGIASAYELLNNQKNQLNDLLANSKTYASRRAAIQERLSKINPTSIKEATEKPQENPLLAQHLAQKATLEADKTKLLNSGWLPNSTRVQALDAQLKSLQEQIDTLAKAEAEHPKMVKGATIYQDNPEWQNLQSQLDDINMQEKSEQAQVAQLEQQITQYETLVKTLPQKESDVNDKVRDAKILQAQYDDLATKREQSITKENMDKLAGITTLRPIGTIYSQPTGGKAKTAMMLVGLMIFGLILGIGVTLLAEWADPTVRYASDVQRRLGVPVLISLPEMAPLMMVTAAPKENEAAGGRPLLPARDE